MKNLVSATILIFAICFVFSSCGTDNCSDVVCGANGSCTNGVCVCDPGYEKDASGTCVLSTSANAKFIGFWDAADTCSNGVSPFVCEIKAFPGDPTKLKINNFYGFFINDVIADVNNNTLNIANQRPDSDSTFVLGTGNYNATTGKIIWNYTVEDRNTPANTVTTVCSSVWTKR